ncbi:MAG TPA: zinc ribbon domain-containing protein [Dehalococcoidia bacterium]|jgi:putative FmdB family regulatory protein|nr:zinc ribbon domain-containing protein [Dehalococcoidia bacterium]
MPLYEYYCPPCGSQFEVLRPVSQMNNAATCPEGHTTNNRVLSLFAPLARGEGVPVMTMDASAGGDSCCGGSCSCC